MGLLGWWKFFAKSCQPPGVHPQPAGWAAVPGVGGDPLQQLDEPGRQRGEEGLRLETGLEKHRQALHGPSVAADNLVLRGHRIGDEGVAAAEVLREGGEGVKAVPAELRTPLLVSRTSPRSPRLPPHCPAHTGHANMTAFYKSLAGKDKPALSLTAIITLQSEHSWFFSKPGTPFHAAVPGACSE